jgi:hypothetical protein
MRLIEEGFGPNIEAPALSARRGVAKFLGETII